ncbi:hypothetical protein HAV15_001998 [Penicillium sp. str. |nr:hypothetical protein HAV15_001998 [Penicillium sp. str. \
MNNTQPGTAPSVYCGKRVVVSVNGQQSDLQLFIGDGCQRGVGSSLSDIWDAEGAPALTSVTPFSTSCPVAMPVRLVTSPSHGNPRRDDTFPFHGSSSSF